jgi:hypothetical protein
MLGFFSLEIQAYSPKNPAHHLFNTSLLGKMEQQIGITGNYKIGLNENWEIGTQALLALGPSQNIYFRHRMFDFGQYKTVITGHLAYLNKPKGYGGFLSVNTSMPLSETSVLTGGVFNLISVTGDQNFFQDDLNKNSIYFLTSSLDSYFSDSWSFNWSMMVPIYGYLEVSTESADGSIELFPLMHSRYRSTLSWITWTYSGTSFNLELGLLAFTSREQIGAIPYFNMFWRIAS